MKNKMCVFLAVKVIIFKFMSGERRVSVIKFVGSLAGWVMTGQSAETMFVPFGLFRKER